MSTNSTRQTYLQACLKAERSALDLAMSQLKESQEECKRLLQRPVTTEAHEQASAAVDVFARLRSAIGTFPRLDAYVTMGSEERQKHVEALFTTARNEGWEVVSNDTTQSDD